MLFLGNCQKPQIFIPLNMGKKKEPSRIDHIIGGNLKRLRGNAKMSQQQFADMVGVDKSKVSGWESGNVPLGKGWLEKLCGRFEVPLGEFYYEATSTIVTDEEEKKILQTMRESPDIKHQIVAIAEALASFDAPKSGKGDTVIVPKKRTAKKGRKTA